MTTLAAAKSRIKQEVIDVLKEITAAGTSELEVYSILMYCLKQNREAAIKRLCAVKVASPAMPQYSDGSQQQPIQSSFETESLPTRETPTDG